VEEKEQKACIIDDLDYVWHCAVHAVSCELGVGGCDKEDLCKKGLGEVWPPQNIKETAKDMDTAYDFRRRGLLSFPSECVQIIKAYLMKGALLALVKASLSTLENLIAV
jgi:hypothetical protein